MGGEPQSCKPPVTSPTPHPTGLGSGPHQEAGLVGDNFQHIGYRNVAESLGDGQRGGAILQREREKGGSLLTMVQILTGIMCQSKSIPNSAPNLNLAAYLKLYPWAQISF